MTTQTLNPEEAVTKELLEKLDARTAAQLQKELEARDARIFTRFEECLVKAVNAVAAASRPGTGNTPLHLPGLEVDSKAVEQYSLANVFQGLANGNLTKVAPRELEISKACMEAGLFSFDALPPAVRRNMASTPDSSLGVFIPSTVMTSAVIPLLQANSVLFTAGAQRMPGLKGDLFIPKRTGASTVSWINHDTTGTPSAFDKTSVTYSQVRFWGKTCIAAVELSNKTINQSAVAVEMLVREALGIDLALEIDRVGINGSGGSGQPMGFLQRPNIGSTAISSALTAATVYNKLLTIRGIPRSNNVNSTKFCWILHPDHLTALEQMLDPTDGSQPKARRLITDASPDKLLGFPYYLTTQCPTDKLAFVAADYLKYGEWGGAFVFMDSQTVNGRLTTQFGVAMEVDWQLTQDKAVSVGTSIS